ncbi:MAG: helix-turn-helix domain-containing protein [Thiohalospira sp.]
MKTQLYAIKDAEELIDKFREIIKEEIRKNTKDQTDFNETPFIKIDEVCRILQVSKPTVYQWVNKDLIKIYKISSRSYFNKEEILDFLKSQK